MGLQEYDKPSCLIQNPIRRCDELGRRERVGVNREFRGRLWASETGAPGGTA
jgi:hypothetical protein